MEPNKFERTDLVEVTVNNIGVTEFSLGQLPNLRAAKTIIRIEAFSVAQVTIAPSSKAVINTTVFNKAFLKMIDIQNNEYRTMPLISLQENGGTRIPDLNSPAIDTEKSKIVVGSNVGLLLNEVFLLAVTYEKYPQNI